MAAYNDLVGNAHPQTLQQMGWIWALVVVHAVARLTLDHYDPYDWRHSPEAGFLLLGSHMSQCLQLVLM